MGALSLGWKLIGLSCVTLVVAVVLSAFPIPAPHRTVVRRAAAGLAIVAVITLMIVVIIGPGPWCGPGDAYKAPGCA